MSNARSYIAGLGSGGALLAAVAIAFATLAALVAFTGLPGLGPGGSAGDENGAIVLVDPAAPEAAGAAAASPAATPAATPSPLPAEPVGTGPGTADAGPSIPSAPDSPSPPPPPPIVTEPPVPPAPPSPTPPPPREREPRPRDLETVVGALDGTLRDTTGLDLGLGVRTKALTDLLDDTIEAVAGEGGLGLRLRRPELPQILDLSRLNGLLPPP